MKLPLRDISLLKKCPSFLKRILQLFQKKLEGIVLKNGTVVKIYHLTDPEFARLCGVELTDNEFTEVKVDDNGQVINLKNGGKKNED